MTILGYYPHFTGGETEAQTGLRTFPSSVDLPEGRRSLGRGGGRGENACSGHYHTPSPLTCRCLGLLLFLLLCLSLLQEISQQLFGFPGLSP